MFASILSGESRVGDEMNVSQLLVTTCVGAVGRLELNEGDAKKEWSYKERRGSTCAKISRGASLSRVWLIK